MVAEQINKLKRLKVFPPIYDLELDQELILDIEAGDVLSITDITKHNPIDPFNGGRGWTNQLAIVTEAKPILSGDISMMISVALVASVDTARIAPACLVTGSGVLYFTVEELEYSLDTTPDYDLFVAGDRIDHRAEDGSSKGTYTIDSIDSVNHRVYVTAGGTPAVAADDYLVFNTYASPPTTNESLFAFLAESDALLDGADDAQEWT